MSSREDSEHDPVLDFFDVRKKFERIVIAGGYTKGRLKVTNSPQLQADDDDDDELDNQEYWKEYRAKEEQRTTALLMQERTGGTDTHGAGVVEGSHMSGLEHLTTTAGSQVLGSYADSSTFRTSSERGPGERENLAKKFNFGKHRDNKLPISEEREKILDIIQGHPVTVISGATGCGKTTQIPQFVLDSHVERNKPVNIVVTQPRRIAAQSVARRVCFERNWELGRLVGYKVGMDHDNASRDTRLLYCTAGILKKMIIARKTLTEWTHVVLDEVHERSEDMDFLLLLCKKLITSNSRYVKLILMSATINVQAFRDYFSFVTPGSDVVDAAATFELPRNPMHKVFLFYSDESALAKLLPPNTPPVDYNDGPQLQDQCVVLAKEIIIKLDDLDRKGQKNTGTKGTVLVFLPGEREILEVKGRLQKDKELASSRGWHILVLHSRIPIEDTLLVFEKPIPGRRKIILATNIAESSITIPDVEYVIDFCLTKNLMADPETNYVALKLQWADKNSCDQRKGRAGRVNEGRVFRLVSKEFYELFIPDQHEPEMKRAPLEKIILDTKLLDFGSPKELLALAMDPPNLDNIKKTVLHLKQVGALLPTVNQVPCKDDGDLTVLGEIVAGLPVDIKLGKLILYGHLFGVLEECVVIAAGLSNKSIFAMPMEKKLEAYASKLVWADRSFSDCMAVFMAYATYAEAKRQGRFQSATVRDSRRLEQDWCYSRYLQVKVLRDMEVTIEELHLNLKRMQIQNFHTPNRPQLTWPDKYRFIQYCVFGAFYPNYFIRHQSPCDLREVDKAINGGDPMTSVFLTGFPQDQAKFGLLYENDIKDMLKLCCDPSNIFVEFSGSKVIVQFGHSPRNSNFPDPRNTDTETDNLRELNISCNLTGEIIHQVYVAIKLKKLTAANFMQLRVCATEKEATEMLEEMLARQVGEPVKQESFVNFGDIGRINPPSVSVKEVVLMVVHVNNPTSFWCRYADHERDMDKIDEAVEQVVMNGHAHKVKGKDDLRVNCIYLAPFTDEDGCTDYYRARLDGFRGTFDRVRVHYIDYGNDCANVRADDILVLGPTAKRLYPDLVSKPAMALECSLAGIKPNPARSTKGIWGSDVVQEFRSTIEQQEILAKIYSVTAERHSPLVSIEAFINGVSVNEDLKMVKTDNGEKILPSAVEAQESYRSDLNHDRRNQSDSFPEKLRKYYDEEQKFNLVQGSKVSRNKGGRDPKLCDDFVHLRGPFHPLEMKLVGAHRIGSSKGVRIDQDSVNSVLLERFPTDEHDQWLVAAHVGMSPNGSFLLLRNTSFLPNHHGLGALLTMIFSPCVEMKCDERRMKYTGALVGLGYHNGRSPRTNGMEMGSSRNPGKVRHYDKDHDMALTFDVEVTNEDVNLINKIRYKINRALSRQLTGKAEASQLTLDALKREAVMEITDQTSLAETQDYLVKNMTELLNRPRKSVQRQCNQDLHDWQTLPPREYLLTPQVIDDATNFLKVVTSINLRRDNDVYRGKKRLKILEQVRRLHNLAERPFTRISERCPVCPMGPSVTLTSSSEVRAHISGKCHLDHLSNL